MQTAQPDRQVCNCYGVKLSVINQVILEGANTLDEVSGKTYAAQGCAGCRFEINDLIKDYQEKHSKKQ